MDITKFKEIFSKSDYQLPIRWDGKDFYATLYNHLKKYREDIEKFYPDLYADVKTVCRGICAAVGYSFRAYPGKAYESFKGVMKILGKDPLLVEKEDINKDPLYRVVDVESDAVPKRQRVFHVPFSKRSKMSTKRYSIPGFPCLYLGTSVELCCMELNKDPKRDNVCVSRYELQTDERLINLIFGINQKPVFDNDEFKIFDVSIKPEKAINTMCNNDLDIAKYIKWYPLISACSYIRAMSDDDYSAEYIIPQLFIQWVRSEDEEAVVGIKYFSCSSIQASTLGNNYVFATTGTPYHARNPKADYCVKLSHRFKLTEPRFIKDYDSIDACVEKMKNDKLDYIEDYNASEDKGIETNYSISEGVFAIGSYAFSGCYKAEKIDIPESVMSIGNHAFLDCSSLTDINIPDSVTSIGYSAFYRCSSLTSITIPDSVTSIGESAFEGCTSLTNIIVDESNEYYTSVDGVLYNKDKSKLLCYPAKKPETEFEIPNSATIIGSSAFSGCSELTSVVISSGMVSIGDSAFSDCSSLISITIPDSVTSIGKYAFSVCSFLSSIKISDNLKRISEYTFHECNSLTSIIIPNSVMSIGEYAFSGCRSLTSITIPDSVTSIGNFAFSYCNSLASIAIPDSVTSIGNSAFSDCNSLASIAIPDSVTSIGNSAFSDCSSLTSITVNGKNEHYASVDDVLYNKEKTTLVCYPPKKSQKSFTIPDSVTSIGYSAFYGCSKLTSIAIPDSVTSIGNSAFSDCSSLTSITISDSITSIGNSAFYACDSLKTVHYSGTQEQKEKINIAEGNEDLLNAVWIYKSPGKKN